MHVIRHHTRRIPTHRTRQSDVSSTWTTAMGWQTQTARLGTGQCSLSDLDPFTSTSRFSETTQTPTTAELDDRSISKGRQGQKEKTLGQSLNHAQFALTRRSS